MECLRGHTTRALTVLPSPTKSTAIVGVVLCAVVHSGDRAVTGSVSVLIHGHSANAVPAYKSWPLCYFTSSHTLTKHASKEVSLLQLSAAAPK